jgi:hypothetical protein
LQNVSDQSEIILFRSHAINTTQKGTAQLKRETEFTIVTKWVYEENRPSSYPESNKIFQGLLLKVLLKMINPTAHSKGG